MRRCLQLRVLPNNGSSRRIFCPERCPPPPSLKRMNLEQCAVVSHLCPTCPHFPWLSSPPNVAVMSHVSSDTRHVFVYQLAAALILCLRSVSSRPSSSSSSSSASSQSDDGTRTQHRPHTSGCVVNGTVLAVC